MQRAAVQTDRDEEQRWDEYRRLRGPAPALEERAGEPRGRRPGPAALKSAGRASQQRISEQSSTGPAARRWTRTLQRSAAAVQLVTGAPWLLIPSHVAHYRYRYSSTDGQEMIII